MTKKMRGGGREARTVHLQAAQRTRQDPKLGLQCKKVVGLDLAVLPASSVPTLQDFAL